MPGTSHRARYALGSTVVALSLALLAGALPFFGGASADNTRELLRVSFRPVNAPPLGGWRSDHGEPYDSRRAYGWVRDNSSGEPVSMTACGDGEVLRGDADGHVHHDAAARGRSGDAG